MHLHLYLKNPKSRKFAKGKISKIWKDVGFYCGSSGYYVEITRVYISVRVQRGSKAINIVSFVSNRFV